MFGRALVRDVQQAAFRVPKIVVERVVHHHAYEAAHHDRGINFDEGTFALSLANVTSKKVVDATNKLVEEHLRQFMLFEGGVEQQPLKLRIVFVVIESAESERLKHGAIVFSLDAVGRHFCRLKPAARARFVIEDGGVEFFFGGEVSKDHGLGDARRLGDLLGRGPAKTSFGKEAYCNR